MTWRDLPARPGPKAAAICAATAIAGGVLWVVATAPIGWWPLAWIAFLPTLWLIDGAATARRAGAWAYLTGVVTTALGFHWISELIVTQVGLPAPVGWLAVLALGAYQGLIFWIAGRAIRALRQRGWPMTVVAPLGLVTGEMVVPVIFPYHLAITQAPVVPVIQLAELTGPIGVTALLAMSAGAIWDAAIAKRWRWSGGAAGALVAVLVFGFVRIAQIEERRAAAPTLRVALVSEGVASHAQGGRERAERQAVLARLQVASAAAVADGAQLVVWTESGFPFNLPRSFVHDFPDSSTIQIRRGFTAPLVFGSLTFGEHHDGVAPVWNSALLLDQGGSLVATHDKVHRVLGSEYNPLVEWFPGLAKILPVGHFEGGDAPVILPLRIGEREIRLAPMICLEDILPGHGRELGAASPHLLVNLTNDSWFGNREPWQHLALAVFRSVEQRTEMVRAVNLGPSSHVDATGAVRSLGPTSRGGSTLLVDAALLEGGGTVYGAIGNLVGWLMTATTLVVWLVLPRLRRRGRVS